MKKIKLKVIDLINDEIEIFEINKNEVEQFKDDVYNSYGLQVRIIKA